MNTGPRLSVDAYFIEMARLAARRSTCLRRAVGCVLVDELNHVVATGYNGVGRGLPHCNEQTGFDSIYSNGVDKSLPLTGQATGTSPVFGHACPAAHAPSGTELDGCEAIHAEQNALLQCRDVMTISTCYVTHSPCVHCTKLLLNTGCYRIVYAEEYSHVQARTLWERSGRVMIQLGKI